MRFHRLTAGDGAIIGHLYLDLYARDAKRGGAWMDVNRARRESAGTEKPPAAYIVCNFGRGTAERPATFDHHEVITLFHEMGHALHALLTEQSELGVSCINGVEWDAVELPSQFMENFCWEWEALQSLTAHVETGEALPRALFDKMISARNFHSGLATLRQLEFALFDMELHDRVEVSNVSPLDVWMRVRREIGVTPIAEWNRFPNGFSHIFGGGYAAGYYGYLWAEVMSADAYAAFTEDPQHVADTAARFRREILARGGSRPMAENFKAFRGRKSKPDAFLASRGIG